MNWSRPDDPGPKGRRARPYRGASLHGRVTGRGPLRRTLIDASHRNPRIDGTGVERGVLGHEAQRTHLAVCAGDRLRHGDSVGRPPCRRPASGRGHSWQPSTTWPAGWRSELLAQHVTLPMGMCRGRSEAAGITRRHAAVAPGIPPQRSGNLSRATVAGAAAAEKTAGEPRRGLARRLRKRLARSCR